MSLGIPNDTSMKVYYSVVGVILTLCHARNSYWPKAISAHPWLKVLGSNTVNVHEFALAAMRMVRYAKRAQRSHAKLS